MVGFTSPPPLKMSSEGYVVSAVPLTIVWEKAVDHGHPHGEVDVSELDMP